MAAGRHRAKNAPSTVGERRPVHLRVIMVAALVTAGLVATAAPAAAATFTVTRADDPSPNGCAVDGCSLREAIIDANTNANPLQEDVIVFDIVGLLVSLTLGNEAEGANGNVPTGGDLDVSQTVRIEGAGVTVDASDLMSGGLATPDRVLHVHPSADGTTLTINSLTLTGGETTGFGGGIHNEGSTVNLNGSVVDGNVATMGGGGIYAGSIIGPATTILDDSQVVDNFTRDEGDGGGIYNGESDDLTLRNDTEVSGNTTDGDGGGIYNLGHTEILSGSIVGTDDPEDFGGGNVADLEGGGVYTLGRAPGTLIVDESSISGNFAGSHGGGIYNDRDRVEVTASDLFNNTAGMTCVECLGSGGDGGGIWTWAFFDEESPEDSPGLFVDEETSIRGNHAVPVCDGGCVGGNGGGVYNTGHTEIRGGTDVGPDNRAEVDGGGIWTGQILLTLLLSEVSVIDNVSGGDGGGIYNLGDVVRIDRTAIAGNTAENGYGGGVWTTGDEALEAENTTISGNAALSGEEEAPGSGLGGGIYLASGSFSFHSVTMNENVADEAGGNIATGENVEVGSEALLTNTIVAAGEPTNCAIGEGDDVVSLDYNLSDEGGGEGDPDTCGFDAPNDILGMDPNLAPLMLNAPGLTETHALNAGSPAIDSGPPTPAEPEGAACLETDQRGVDRPQDGDGNGSAICDRGAYERLGPGRGPGGGGGSPQPGPPSTQETPLCDILGTTGNDILLGNDANNVLCGLEGDDLLRGGAGNDQLFGNEDDDLLDGGPGDDLLDGGPGNDTGDYRGGPGPLDADLKTGIVEGQGASTDTLSGVENLFGTAFDDVIRGDEGPNLLRGNDGNDLIRGRGGIDRVRGGEGDDHLAGGGGDDNAKGGKGTDVVRGNGGGDTLGGGKGVDIVAGGNGDDNAKGGKGADMVRGHKGGDALGGGKGGDRLRGGMDDDTLRGFKGNDHLNGHRGFDNCNGGQGNNTLVNCEA